MPPVQKASLNALEAFTTLDGSQIRELAGPAWTDARHQSLAEATVPPGGETASTITRAPRSSTTSSSGSGRMRLGEEETEVHAGDCVVILPGTPHKLWNPSSDPLVLLCCCAPAYSDDDTVMTGR